ncbi:MAG: hypothetical protein M1831_005025 [Alyxoria varia]|nr:MAG: hypothetical protein M1831_005025 [Alyxoria varia]
MEVLHASSPALANSATEYNSMNAGDMDIDMDIDLGPPPEEDIQESDAMATETAPQQDQSVQSENTGPEVAPEKVHIRGLDNLTTEDIKAFANEHYQGHAPIKIEWIDDASANIVYPDSHNAFQALASFSAAGISDNGPTTATELREANRLSTQPDTILYVRQASTGDVKQPNAREASRFYLLNPDKNPWEQRQKNNYDRRGGRRGRDGYRPKRRRDDEEYGHFDVNMYDDDPESLASRGAGGHRRDESMASMGSDDSRRLKRAKFGQRGERKSRDLFADRYNAPEDRLRGRSASPGVFNEDGRFGFDDDDTHLHHRRSSPSPFRKPRNLGKELIASPASRGRSNALDSNSAPEGLELFPNRSSPSKDFNLGKELFPRSGSVASTHRRTDAFDYADDGAEQLVARSQGERVPLTDGRSSSNGLKTRSLADRITGGPLKRKAQDVGDQPVGFSIRGVASQQDENPGFQIKGVAQAMNPRVKELFPEKKPSNAGRDLFSRIDGGRRVPRQKAEDLFG